MQVHCCQLNLTWEDKTANFENLRKLLTVNPIKQQSLLILPEMFNTGFSMNFASLAENLESSRTLTFLGEIAREHQCHILAGMTLDRGGKLSNDAILINSEGEFQGSYSKIHPFSPSGEKAAGTPGHEVITLPLGDWTLAPFICYDLRFPEIFRLATPAAELLIVIANWPTPRVEHWITLLQARAIENQAYVIGVNRIGSDPNLEFPGRSLIIDPQGKILCDAGAEETILSASLDLSYVRQWRADFPATADRTTPAQLSINHLT